MRKLEQRSEMHWQIIGTGVVVFHIAREILPTSGGE
jgi:hypothetical protein